MRGLPNPSFEVLPSRPIDVPIRNAICRRMTHWADKLPPTGETPSQSIASALACARNESGAAR